MEKGVEGIFRSPLLRQPEGGGGDKTQTKMQHFHHGYNKCEMTEDDDTNETGRERNAFRVKDVNVLIYNDGL